MKEKNTQGKNTKKPLFMQRTTLTAIQVAVDHAFTGTYVTRFRLTVTYAPTRDQRQYAKSRRLSKAEDAQEAEEWIKSEDGITETMTNSRGVYTCFVSTSPPENELDDA